MKLSCPSCTSHKVGVAHTIPAVAIVNEYDPEIDAFTFSEDMIMRVSEMRPLFNNEGRLQLRCLDCDLEWSQRPASSQLSILSFPKIAPN